MKKKKVMKLASRGKRLGAFCIDAVIPAFNGILFITYLAGVMYRTALYFGSPFGMYGYGNGFGKGHVAAGPQPLVPVMIILAVIYTAAQIYFFTRSQTLGKAALGLRVISSRDGRPIGFWMMLLREAVVKKASECILCLGYVWVCIDEKNRGWHDKILDTYVIDLKESRILSERSAVTAGQTSGSLRPPEALQSPGEAANSNSSEVE